MKSFCVEKEGHGEGLFGGFSNANNIIIATSSRKINRRHLILSCSATALTTLYYDGDFGVE